MVICLVTYFYPNTTGNCPEKRNKTCGKDIGMIEWDGNAGEWIINLNNEYVSNDEKDIFRTAFLQILVICNSRGHSLYSFRQLKNIWKAILK